MMHKRQQTGEVRELHKPVRRLGAFKPTLVPDVRKNGALADDDEEGLARWAEHFATLLGGTQVKKIETRRHAPQHHSRTARVLCRMRKRRAVGPDALASEIWIASGDRLERAHEACGRWNAGPTL